MVSAGIMVELRGWKTLSPGDGMTVALELLNRDGKTSYRVTIGRKYESTASYEISTNDIAEARAFLLTYVKDASVKVELSVSATGEDVYRFLGAEPPGWTPPSAP